MNFIDLLKNIELLILGENKKTSKKKKSIPANKESKKIKKTKPSK
tara:strand:+ start:40882 stop:41016 length:135 start_codon:yes stop_codon:yes gene_type:complete